VNICFDLDDTIFFTSFHEDKYTLIGAREKIIAVIRELYYQGNTIVVQTGRHWKHLMDTKALLEEYNVPYHSLVMGKPPCDYYVDDKGVTPEKFLELHKAGSLKNSI